MKEKIMFFLEEQGYYFDEDGNLMLEEIDSVEFIGLIISLEEEFDVEIPDEFLNVNAIETIDAIVSILEYVKR